MVLSQEERLAAALKAAGEDPTILERLKCPASREIWLKPYFADGGPTISGAIIVGRFRPSPIGFTYIRVALGCHRARLAKLLDVSGNTVLHWEQGVNRIPRAAWFCMVALTDDFDAAADRLRGM
jgi:hypothetical protein